MSILQVFQRVHLQVFPGLYFMLVPATDLAYHPGLQGYVFFVHRADNERNHIADMID